MYVRIVCMGTDFVRRANGRVVDSSDKTRQENTEKGQPYFFFLPRWQPHRTCSVPLLILFVLFQFGFRGIELSS